MIDFTGVKAVTIPEGGVKKITRKSDGTVLWQKGYKNWVKFGTEADGVTIYNNGKGWKAQIRLNSYGQEVALTAYETTGFIPAKFGDTLRCKNISSLATSNTKLYFYDSTFAALNFISADKRDFSFLNSGAYIINDTLVNTGLMTSIENMAYFRLSVSELSDNSVITVNEEII